MSLVRQDKIKKLQPFPNLDKPSWKTGKEILLAVQVVRHHFALKNLDKGGTGDLREIREVKMSHVLKRLHQRQIREETRDATSPRQRERVPESWTAYREEQGLCRSCHMQKILTG